MTGVPRATSTRDAAGTVGALGAVVVFGSLNVDSTSYVEAFPAPGETIRAHGFQIALGGKGTNQAVAAHVAGLPVELVARVGDDASGAFARVALERLGLSLAAMREVAGTTTGVAQITVADSGENTVIVTAGANLALTAGSVDDERERVAAAALVLTQGELTVDAIDRVASLADELGVRFVLNLAPPAAVAAATLRTADPLVLNEHEARAVGLGTDAAPGALLDEWRGIAASAAGGIARSVVVTLGAAGAVAADATGSWAVAAPRVVAVDTTGAGDGFTGTLAAFLAEGRPLPEALRIAVAAGALAVQSRGTVDSYAPRDEVLATATADAAAVTPPATPTERGPE
ncbi:ribokinase [Agromyces subbeticus]|uniref:ribokinase n=1 Tax=Agromyces subbeticus TaxID=293890 RepID=UPI0003B7B094|nr:ribokinase [Agromyces subbeticus]